MTRRLSVVGPYGVSLAALLGLNFFLPRLLPGDPITALQDPNNLADPVMRLRQRSYYGLDQSMPAQFGHYLTQLAHGDLGTSIHYNQSVLKMLGERLPWTLLLVGSAFLLSGAVGILAGVHAGWRRGRRSDRALLAVLLALDNVPSYALAYVLLLVFSVNLGWLPLGGATTRFVDLSPLARIGDVLVHLVLPGATLALSLIAGKFLLMRGSMVAELGQDYILLARAKGLGEGRIKYRYAARNALLPVVTLMTLQLGLLVTGTIFTERIFDYPGMGRLAFEAITYRDYPLLAGVFLVFSAAVLLANLVLDLFYIKLDPRTESPA